MHRNTKRKIKKVVFNPINIIIVSIIMGVLNADNLPDMVLNGFVGMLVGTLLFLLYLVWRHCYYGDY